MGRAANNAPGHPLRTEEGAQEVRMHKDSWTVVKGLAFTQGSGKRDWKARGKNIWSKDMWMDTQTFQEE